MVPVDQVINGIKANRLIFALGFGLGLALALLLWFARIANALRDVVAFFKSLSKRPHDLVSFTPNDLEREVNPRFGFSFLHPKTWDRRDPMNADGNTYFDPKHQDVRMLAWGSYGVLYPTLDVWVSETLRYEQVKPCFRLIQNVESGKHMVSWEKQNGVVVETSEQIEGRRLVYEYKEEGKKLTVMATFTQGDDIQYGLQCEAPSSLYPAYEKLFLLLVSSLRVLKRESGETT